MAGQQDREPGLPRALGPGGVFQDPDVRTLGAYPQLVLKELKALYPTFVVNIIVTAIGGENSAKGARRFEDDVLTHKPDVVFIAGTGANSSLHHRTIGGAGQDL